MDKSSKWKIKLRIFHCILLIKGIILLIENVIIIMKKTENVSLSSISDEKRKLMVVDSITESSVPGEDAILKRVH